MEISSRHDMTASGFRLFLMAVCEMADAEFDRISNVTVSLKAWRGDARLEIREGERLAQIVFEPLGHAKGERGPWVRAPGPEIVEGSDGPNLGRGLQSLLRLDD